jgi:hypothetical protein
MRFSHLSSTPLRLSYFQPWTSPFLLPHTGAKVTTIDPLAAMRMHGITHGMLMRSMATPIPIVSVRIIIRKIMKRGLAWLVTGDRFVILCWRRSVRYAQLDWNRGQNVSVELCHWSWKSDLCPDAAGYWKHVKVVEEFSQKVQLGRMIADEILGQNSTQWRNETSKAKPWTSWNAFKRLQLSQIWAQKTGSTKPRYTQRISSVVNEVMLKN